MSTGSISTFHTTATPQAKVGARPSNKRKSTKPIQETSADQASVLTSTSMSEVDFNMLMQHITVALQIKLSSLTALPVVWKPGSHLETPRCQGGSPTPWDAVGRHARRRKR